MKTMFRKYIICQANVIIMTVSNSGDALLYTIFQSQLVVVDKASRAIEPDMWNILRNYAQTPLVIVEDNTQLPLVVFGDDNINSFTRLLQMSLFQ